MTKNTTKIRIKLKSFDIRSLAPCAMQIVETAKRSGARVAGPVPMPKRIKRVTVNRSVHADKKSMEQFEQSIHKMVIDIYDSTHHTVELLKKLNVSSGVQITIDI